MSLRAYAFGIKDTHSLRTPFLRAPLWWLTLHYVAEEGKCSEAPQTVHVLALKFQQAANLRRTHQKRLHDKFVTGFKRSGASPRELFPRGPLNNVSV